MKGGNAFKVILRITILWAFLKAHQDIMASDTAPEWLKLMPLWLLLVAFAWWGRHQLLPQIFKFFFGFIRMILGVLLWIVSGVSPNSGARYMSLWEELKFFGGKGFLIDGKSKRLSEKISYQGIVLEAGVGGGKTTGHILPNIYSLNHASLVITDTSGELFDQTSRFLLRKGYHIQIYNLRDVFRSHAFNPLANANSFSEIAQLAHLLIKSSPATGNKDDPFWSAGAEKIVRIIIQCMKNRNEPEKCTLPELKAHLSKCATATGADHPFSQWVMESTLDDPATWQDYLAFITGNEKTTSSMISTADVALMAIANPDLAGLTSQQEFDFAAIQKRKTAVYVLCRQQDMSYYAFLLSSFFTQLFNTLLASPDPKNVPVYALLDEFGQIIIPNFAAIASTARKYKVALFLCLQSAMQLELRYSRAEAHTILDSLRTQIYLSGTNLEAAERISRRLGKKRPKSEKDRIAYMDGNLMNPDEIINMKDDEAILLHGNQRAHRYRVLPYFKNFKFQGYSKMRPIELPHTPRINRETS